MTISDACKAAMVEHGVLLKDGRPAGAYLFEKNPLRVAIVQADENGEFPEGFMTDEVRSLLPEPLQYGDEILDTKAAPFEHDIEQITRDALGYWREGDIEFVHFQDNPDLTIFAFDTIMKNSFATFPVNDHPDQQEYGGQEKAYIGISTERVGETTEELIRHEFGHNGGIMHPNEALRDAAHDPDTEICDRESLADQMRFTDVQREPGYMGYGEHEESWYDQGTRDLVRDGKPSGPGR